MIFRIKYNKKKIVFLSVAGTVLVLYALTFFFGIREVKLRHEAELHDNYYRFQIWYERHSLSEIINPFWKKRFEKDKTFPTWEEYKKINEKGHRVEYFVVLPFLVKSKYEGIYEGYEEYHLWYVFGERFLRRNQLWIQ